MRKVNKRFEAMAIARNDSETDAPKDPPKDSPELEVEPGGGD